MLPGAKSLFTFKIVRIGLSSGFAFDCEFVGLYFDDDFVLSEEFVGLIDKQDELAENLSYGQQKLLSIACCLASEPKVLLLDEPTSFLDNGAKDEMYELLTELWSNEAPTAIIVSHDEHWMGKFKCRIHELLNGKIC